MIASPVAAVADQSSQPSAPAAGHVTAGAEHSCAVLLDGARCWGFGANRRLGYGTTDTIGDDETPGSVGPIDFGPGLSATAISAGIGHTCALLGDATVRCWGFGANGRLGYGSPNNSPPGQSPGAAGPVDLGGPAKAISAGDSHTCAILVDGSVRCWGYAAAGQLGYSKPDPAGAEDPPSIGDDPGETPATAGAVNLGAGRTAIAISGGGSHTCAVLDNGAVRCWGYAAFGALGYANANNIGDNETPNTVDPVFLGDNRTATAISAGNGHTCALLDDKTVRCWGFGFYGQLGTAGTNDVGVLQRPGDVAPAALGSGAVAISAGGAHSCALLENGAVRCWGRGQLGQLGYGNADSIGDDEFPSAAGPVNLGAGRTALAVDAGLFHTCATLVDNSVRCWGFGSAGRLGSCNQNSIGDNESPSAVRPIDFGNSGDGCRVVMPPPGGGATSDPVADPGPPAKPADMPAGPQPPDPRSLETARGRELRTCLRAAARRAKAARSPARRACLTRHGRTPGRVTRVRARATSRTRVVLTFAAPGSDGRREPAARGYLVRQSLRPLRSGRDAAQAPALCRGSCRFEPSAVGETITLTITGLLPRTTYYYAVAARDNVSNRLGPRSTTVRVRTR